MFGNNAQNQNRGQGTGQSGNGPLQEDAAATMLRRFISVLQHEHVRTFQAAIDAQAAELGRPSNDFTVSFKPGRAGPQCFVVPRIAPGAAVNWDTTYGCPFYDVWRFTNPDDTSTGTWEVEWVYAYSNVTAIPADEPRTKRIQIPAKTGTFLRFRPDSPWQAILVQQMWDERGVVHPIPASQHSRPNQQQHPMGGGGHGGLTAGGGSRGTQMMVSPQGGGGRGRGGGGGMGGGGMLGRGGQGRGSQGGQGNSGGGAGRDNPNFTSDFQDRMEDPQQGM